MIDKLWSYAACQVAVPAWDSLTLKHWLKRGLAGTAV
jgi:hypothetical protein